MKARSRKSPIRAASPSLGGDLARTGYEPALSQVTTPVHAILSSSGVRAPEVVGRRRPLVIIADPDRDAADVAQYLGEQSGYSVRCTHNGLDAWNLLRAFQPNLMVINRQLVEISGLQLIRQIRMYRDRVVSGTPILITSLHLESYELDQCFQCGADDILLKPIDEGSLLRCWHRLVRGIYRPAPLMALLNDNMIIQQSALSWLLKTRPTGLVQSLQSLLWLPEAREIAHAALERLGTAEARAVLQGFGLCDVAADTGRSV